MEINLVAEAFKFLILGMSTVFMFLILLVYVLQIQSKIIMKFFPEKKEALPQNGSSSKKSKANDDLAVVAAIAASIQTFKK